MSLGAYTRDFTVYCTCLGPDYLKVQDYSKQSHMDSSVLAEAIACSLADPGKEFCHSAVLALTLVLDTAGCLLGSKEKVR